MDTVHARALQWARSTLGQHEDPMGSNTGSFVLSCQRTTWLGGTRWPWCVAWYMRAMLVAGVKMPWRGAGAYAFLDWAKTVGRVVPIEHAQPGDALIWNIGSGHCSMLEKYDAARAQITDIGGNVDDSVARRVRPKSLLRGAISIPPLGVPPAKPRHFEVVTSESGHAKVVWNGTAKGFRGAFARLMAKYPGGFTVRRRK